VHGDVFDTITSNYAIIAHLGDIGYNLLLAINRFYNHYRTWRGKGYFSISKMVKARVKKAVNFISKFETALVSLARHFDCDGVICGHIHTAEDKMLDNIHYLNSGDWVESMTAIVETLEGELKLIDYPSFVAELEASSLLESDSNLVPLEDEPEFQKLELPKSLLTEAHLVRVP
ncbi:MAG: UDP-2,3-diacylglucosamine diphosphatase, partial [Verrucomicrobiae bacterium]|nr:UDP-2,3-diacylglucosamine diphosphatase [Verrucomicrobiae bacterium]